MKPADPADFPRDDSGAVEQTEQPQAAAVEPQAETAPPHPKQSAPSKAPTVEEMTARMMAGFPGRFVPGPGETAPVEQGPQSQWPGLESAQKLAKLLFFEPGVVVELRALYSKGRAGRVCSGYFDTPHKFLQAAAQRDGDFSGLYATLNKVDPELIARAVNRVQDRAEVTTSDSDITERRWFLIDLDPVRASGISSTDEEHAQALEVSAAIAAELAELGWPRPVRADSGNGGHLLYRLGEGCDDGALLERCLKALAMQFDSEQSVVDTSVTKRAQLTKFYGSMACKGDSIEERPHRRSAILDVPDELVPVTREQLEALAGRLPSERDPAPRHAPPTSKGRQLDIPAMLASAGLEVLRHGTWDAKERWVLEACPWNPSHGPGKAWVARFPSGALAAGCLHSGCAGRGWADLKSLIDPSAWASSASATNVAPTDTTTVAAKADAAADALSVWDGADGEADSIAASISKPTRRRRFAVGDSVRATDHDNIGTILELFKDSALVQFVNKRDGVAKSVHLPLSALEHTRKRSSEIPRRLSVAALLELPPPKLFVEGMLVRGSLIVIYGPSNCGKSFLALDLAMCLASGFPFAGRNCEQVRTNYIAGEGLGGFKKRLLAWSDDSIPRPKEAPWSHFELYPGPVSLLEETQVDKLIDDILSMPERPVALFVDTLARSFAGGDENTAEDMNEFVAACDLIREETGVAVIVIHHTGKAKKGDAATERGSSVLRAAADTMIEIEVGKGKRDVVRTVRCAKQKDLEPFQDFAFVLDQVTTSIIPGELGETSCRVRYVPVPTSEPRGDRSNDTSNADPHEKVIAICNALRDFGDSEGLARGRVLKSSGLSESTFDRYLKTAIDSGRVVKRGEGQRSRYLLKEQVPSSTPNTPKSTPMGVGGDPRTTTPNKPLSLERGVGGGGGVRARRPKASTAVGVRATKKSKPQTKRSKRGSKR